MISYEKARVHCDHTANSTWSS